MKDIELIRIAKLARIALPSEHEHKAQDIFEKILRHFDELSKVNTQGVEPLYHFLEEMPLREDVSEVPLTHSELFDNAPSSVDGCFQIPKFVSEHG